MLCLTRGASCRITVAALLVVGRPVAKLLVALDCGAAWPVVVIPCNGVNERESHY